MSRVRWLVVWILVLAAAVALSTGAAAEKEAKPFAVALPNDGTTRGDWIGTYGTYSYLLGGMRGRRALLGGESVDWSFQTGAPDERVRGWHSSMPTRRNRSVLLEPNGWERTAGCLDDHGEVRPLGEGPNLHVDLSIPEGPFMVSLYFFEIDWIQYRDYQIRVLDAESDRQLLQMHASDFLKGVYKRFVAYGPVELKVVIERGSSPNAQTSGVFVDRLSYPSTETLQTARELLPMPAPAEGEDGGGLESLARSARQRLEELRKQSDEASLAREYILAESRVVEAAGELYAEQPRQYYRGFVDLWGAAEGRLGEAAELMPGGPERFYGRLLRYVVAREGCNYAGARSEIEEVAELLASRSIDFGAGPHVQQEFLEQLLLARIKEGRRNEAVPVARAYVRSCLEHEKANLARMNLVRLGERALKARVTLPFARGLERWKERYGKLSVDERLLLASLYYIAGRHAEASEYYRQAEPDLVLDRKRKWTFLARLTALLRMGRVDEAKKVAGELKKSYPASQELDEAKYRLSVYYYKTRDLETARKAFERLRETTTSVVYKKLCRQYLERIDHQKKIRNEKNQ